MARNGSGTYTLPSGNPVVAGTLIEASWANTTLSDLATAMTDSLSRSGQGGMTAALRLADGTISVPGVAFSSETSSGFYRAGAGDVRLSITGSQVMQFLSTGVAITGTLSASGATTLSGDLTLSGNARRIIGDFSNATVANRTMFQTSSVNGTTIVPALPNGTGSQSVFRAYNNSTPTNSSYIDLTIDSTVAQVNSNREGSGSLLPLAFGVNNAERLRITASGNLLIGSTSESTPGTGFISAANTFGFKNRIINGDMRIDQRNAGTSVSLTSGGVFPVDRWKCFEDTDGTMTAEQVQVAPAGFIDSLLFTTGTADSSLSSAQFCAAFQFIEGFNVADLAWGTASASPITISFWVRSSLTGTFGGAVSNSATNRSYAFTYSISSVNTWEQKSVTIAGDTSGTWENTNSTGIRLAFGLGVGSSYSGSAGSWAAANYMSATGATSVIGTASATFYITGVQLERGSTATSFDFRPYGTELMLCQRYFTNWVGDSSGTGFRAIGSGQCANTTTDMNIVIPLSVAMRANPTLSFSGTVFLLDSSATGNLTSIVTTYAASNQTVWGIFRASAGTFTTGRAGIMYTLNGSTNFVSASAEL